MGTCVVAARAVASGCPGGIKKEEMEASLELREPDQEIFFPSDIHGWKEVPSLPAARCTVLLVAPGLPLSSPCHLHLRAPAPAKCGTPARCSTWTVLASGTSHLPSFVSSNRTDFLHVIVNNLLPPPAHTCTRRMMQDASEMKHRLSIITDSAGPDSLSHCQLSVVSRRLCLPPRTTSLETWHECHLELPSF